MLFAKTALSRSLLVGLLGGSCLCTGYALTRSAQATVSLAAAQPITAQSPPLNGASLTKDTSVPSTFETTVEGEPVTYRLRPYQPQGIPVEMGIPNNAYIPSVVRQDGFKVIRLVSRLNEKTRIEIMWPDRTATLAEMESQLLQAMSQDGANLEEIPLNTPGLSSYPWRRRMWLYRDSDARVTGNIIWGEINGRGFVIFDQSEWDMAESHASTSHAIYSTFQRR